MIAAGSVDRKLSGKKMEGDENLRTVECLRGRLVAERAASRVAKEDAEQMGKKLTELENKMREEIKSRNRAEKRLNLLMKKLDALNLSSYHYVSENSSILEKSDMSSVSSSSFSSNYANCEIQQSETKKSHQENSQDLEDRASMATTPNPSHCGSTEDSLVSEEKRIFDEPGEVNSSLDYHEPKIDCLSSSSGTSNQAQDDYVDNSLALVCVDLPEESPRPDPLTLDASVRDVLDALSSSSGTSDQAQDDYVDNSLALVCVDLPEESPRPDPLTLDASVRDVLDALRYAREKLQMSMERRHMIEVGSK